MLALSIKANKEVARIDCQISYLVDICFANDVLEFNVNDDSIALYVKFGLPIEHVIAVAIHIVKSALKLNIREEIVPTIHGHRGKNWQRGEIGLKLMTRRVVESYILM